MIKVTKSKKDTKEKSEYPCLKCFDGSVILFTAKHTGMRLSYGGKQAVGDIVYGTGFGESSFVPYTGTITLTNE